MRNGFWVALTVMRARATAALIAVLLAVASPVVAQDADIQATIDGQLRAFNDRDVGEAFDFASPMIQGMFGTAENFGLMVQNGFPMVWTNDEVRFFELRDIAGGLYQKVMIRDVAGNLHVLDYKMIETDDGWRIDGVTFLPAPDTGV